MKIVLYAFTGYIGFTGVVSGTTDAMAMKAAKLTISGAVPVVGGILSDASEAVLVSAGIMKNAAGVYGILAVLAIFGYSEISRTDPERNMLRVCSCFFRITETYRR